MDTDPWGDTAIPVPDRFTENGDRGPALDPIDGVVAEPVALDGEPGSSPQWRL